MNSNSPDPNICPTGSVKKVFLDNSNGALTLESTVYPWVTLDSKYTEEYCADGNSGVTETIHECLSNALDKIEADSDFDFGAFDADNDNKIDAITFLHSGYAAETGGGDYWNRIWSHKWGMSWSSSSSGVVISDYHISPALWGTSGNEIGRIGVIGTCIELDLNFTISDYSQISLIHSSS